MKPRYLSRLEPEYLFAAARAVKYQRIQSDLFPGIDVWLRRDDLLDPLISGNKAYKLLFNLLQAREQGVDTLITCGGAWSNHIHATAAAGARFGFRTIGIIRGERPPVLSPTLQDAERFGMQLEFVSRAQYRRRNEPEFLGNLDISESKALYIPEGGANLAGAKGVQLLAKIIEETAPVALDQLWLACGTGISMAGLASRAAGFSVCGVEVLKAGETVYRNVRYWLEVLASEAGSGRATNKSHLKLYRSSTEAFRAESFGCFLINSYHCGGYAKYPRYLKQFQQVFEKQTDIPLDAVYTAKLLYALHCEAKAGHFVPGSKIMVLHSGGLQGRRGIQLYDPLEASVSL